MTEDWEYELLLNLDETWRTRTQLCKQSEILRTMPYNKIVRLLTKLKRKGLVEYRRVSNKHSEYKRASTLPDHAGCQS
jgi:transcription initiation factor IIE alpha subunit